MVAGVKESRNGEECFLRGVFVSCTDLAATFLFSEALTTKEIKIVNFARNKMERDTIKGAYLRVFPWLRKRPLTS